MMYYEASQKGRVFVFFFNFDIPKIPQNKEIFINLGVEQFKNEEMC